MQAHAEHQEDHPQFGQLQSQFLIRHKARRKGAHNDTGKQIAHQRRHAQPIGHHAENIGQHQTRNDR